MIYFNKIKKLCKERFKLEDKPFHNTTYKVKVCDCPFLTKKYGFCILDGLPKNWNPTKINKILGGL